MSSSPLRSSATRVLSKVAGSALSAIAVTSSSCCFMPASKAGAKSASWIWSNGGAPYGSGLGVSSGLARAAAGAWVSVMVAGAEE